MSLKYEPASVPQHMGLRVRGRDERAREGARERKRERGERERERGRERPGVSPMCGRVPHSFQKSTCPEKIDFQAIAATILIMLGWYQA